MKAIRRRMIVARRAADRHPGDTVRDNSGVPVGYISSHYPAISHTFVLREVERCGGRGSTADLLHPPDPARPPAVGGRPGRRAHDCGDPADERGRAGRRPPHAPSCARRAAICRRCAWPGTGAPGARERLWHLFYFAEAMILLRHCRRARHRATSTPSSPTAPPTSRCSSPTTAAASASTAGCSWSLAVHGSVEFYDVTPYALRRQARRTPASRSRSATSGAAS